ncbi:MAG: DUF2975 domain-containing protein [Prevotella sp.]|nr:DUF2975 domain-containing protein [Prevotella sp.]
MKKKLNVFCILMLVLMATNIIIGLVFNFSESAQAFQQGWDEGRKGRAMDGLDSLSSIVMALLALACIFLLIRSFIALVRFILNVNRDKVFVWENIPLLRWTGWGILIPTVVFSTYDLLAHVPADKIYNESMDDIIFGLFCLIVAEVFAIGLKLKEEQDLTI